MQKAIILHGMPSEDEYLNSPILASHNHWFPWLQRELILKGILTQTPEMPRPYAPVYEEWCSLFEQFAVDENTILIGHSLGGGFLVRWLSENAVKVGKVVLVAPWLDPNGELTPNFFDFEIDPNLSNKTQGLTVFISNDDDQEELTSLEILKSKISGLNVREFIGYGHFIFQHMKTNEFPELRDLLLQ